MTSASRSVVARSVVARSVVVTGGTGALGCAVTSAFLAAGDRVVVPWVDKEEQGALAAAEARAVAEGRLVLVEADVTEESGAACVARSAGEAEVLVNGVGGFAGGHGVEETELAVWDRMYRLNLRSAVAVTRALLPAMRRRRRGVIVSVASRAALERPAGLAAYAAAKAGLLVLTDVLQREVAEDGVRVCALLPSTIDTAANRAAMPDADFSRWTTPRQIADVVLWLASEAAMPLRGAVIPV